LVLSLLVALFRFWCVKVWLVQKKEELPDSMPAEAAAARGSPFSTRAALQEAEV
jgi:hypothetical protein